MATNALLPSPPGRDDYTDEEKAEIELFQKQHVFEVAKQTRRRLYEAKLQELEAEFEDEEEVAQEEIYESIATKLWAQGIEQTRKTFVPAYAFDKFKNLPTEIRLRIWSFASRTNNVKVNIIESMNREQTNLRFFSYESDPKRKIGSSALDWPDTFGRDTVPSTLHACRESRLAAEQVYTLMPLRSYDGERTRKIYFNTLYDYFHVHGVVWTEVKILVDLYIKLNSTRPLQRQVQMEMKELQKIRCLVVDFNVFATAPARLWAEFPRLEKLTIGIFPYGKISDIETTSMGSDRFYALKPNPRGRYAKRVSWLTKRADGILNKIKSKELPKWVVPELTVLIRVTEEPIDEEVEAGRDEDDVTSESGNDVAGAEDDEDSTWYIQAEAKLTTKMSNEELSLLKQKHHPSEKVTHPENHPGKKTGDWIEDSETEDERKYCPYLWEDDP